MNITTTFLAGLILSGISIGTLEAQEISATSGQRKELYRPQYHFTPLRNWNNDPNGLVYYKGEYHLFYQYYPEAMEWGPMHWGHAVSKDLLHWKDLPVALYPDSLGYIFSGSAVVDENNTAGFQQGSEKALVAIFTYHQPKTNLESQAIAYSTDKGRTWKKYAGNPVIPNPGITDFRDPKVRWYEPAKKWIMVVSCHDHIAFYSSPDLKSWTHESDFGKDKGSHGGVWECPDLFPLKANGSGAVKWILLVNNGGSPDGGRGTQYFIGDFDGRQFTAADDKTRWLYGGADEYAGITWSNTGDRTIFIGWLANWPAANKAIPSYSWRGGMTLPVTLSLHTNGDSVAFVAKNPVEELKKQEHEILAVDHPELTDGKWVRTFSDGQLSGAVIRLKAKLNGSRKLLVSLKNALNQSTDIIYDRAKRQFVIDRARSGDESFRSESAPVHAVAAPGDLENVELTIYYDRSVLETFIDRGRWAFTDLVFPARLYDRLEISMGEGAGEITQLSVSSIRSVWDDK